MKVQIGLATDAGHILERTRREAKLLAALGPEWKFVESGDFLGDGKADVLIETTSGALFAGTILNGVVQYAKVGGLGADWKVHG